ncbi:hypothetical protein DLAC_00086 [Tieghemostelium lacteum]|uniref:PX domain-containing protein n=1 Tax=Tieghemostelium lacteum TaxID=361077 RepID=A0A152A995_TIELA|nr:hypothetical protein DLAC_00086 [Tieghemostelium lacteum]|eukprot:KYR02637.1 hypothetical protein DLAC_00086 [Tieghemostelium lacteum]
MDDIKPTDARSIEITKAENREVSGKAFTEYIIDIVDNDGKEYTIARRFSEFYSLYQLMKHNFQIKYEFPPKRLNKLNRDLVAMRQKSLQEFIKFLIVHPSPPVRKSYDLSRFLDQNNPVFSNKLIIKKLF